MRQKTVMALGLVLVGASQASNAQTENGVIRLDKLLVSATRIEEEADKVSKSIEVVDRTHIERHQPTSVAEAVAHQANVQIEGGPRPGNQTVNIRGLSGQRVLQTIDGVRQDFQSGHRPSYFLDPELIKRIEVVKGPVSSLWGSGAIGGLVAQYTLTPDDFLGDRDFGGFARLGYNDNNSDQTSSLALAARTGTVSWLLSGYYRDRDDITLGNGDILPGSSAIDDGALLKADWQVSETQKIQLGYRRAQSRGHVPINGAAAITTTSNFLIKRETDTNTLSVDYQLDPVSELVNANILAYLTDTTMGERRLSDGRRDDTELERLGLNVSNVSDLPSLRLLYGIDGYREDFSANRAGSNRPLPPGARSDIWGAYIQGLVPLGDHLTLEIGTRYDTFKTEAESLGSKRADNALSWSGALAWQATPWLTLALRYDEAFRAPGSEELYTTGTHFCMGPGFCNTFIPNPDLDAEKAANTEVSANMTFSDLLGDDQLNIRMTLFRNNVDDFIEQVVTGPFFFPVMNAGNTTWVNVDKARLEGFELSSRYDIGALNLSLTYGQTRGEDRRSGEALSNIPADKWLADANYTLLNGQITAGLRVSHVREQDKLPAATVNMYPSYTLTDLYASWEPQAGIAKGLKLDLAINNVSDRYYRIAFEELHQPGREIRLSTLYRF